MEERHGWRDERTRQVAKRDGWLVAELRATMAEAEVARLRGLLRKTRLRAIASDRCTATGRTATPANWSRRRRDMDLPVPLLGAEDSDLCVRDPVAGEDLRGYEAVRPYRLVAGRRACEAWLAHFGTWRGIGTAHDDDAYRRTRLPRTRAARRKGDQSRVTEERVRPEGR